MDLSTEKIDNDVPPIMPKINQHLNIIRKIGQGTFSTVFLASVKSSAQEIALKYIIPTSHPARVANEFKCLKKMGGSHNVIGLLFAERFGENIVFAMPYFPHDKFEDYCHDLSMDEILDYMKNLLIALAHIHSNSIIHRDIKPSNFLYNRKFRRYSLVDFGLCHKVNVNLNQTRQAIELTTKTCTNENVIPIADIAKVKRRLQMTSEKHVIASSAKNRTNEKVRQVTDRVKRRLEMTPDKCNMSPSSKRIALSPITLNKNTSNCQNRRPPHCKPLFITKDKIQTKTPPSTIGFTRLDLNHNSAENLKISSLDRNTQCQMGNENFLIKSKVKHLKNFSKRICYCFGKSQVCQLCLSRKSPSAPRAGTPGFRAPEVLLRCLNQTTAIDMWSAGVIFLSLLSGCFPFFNARDDMEALAEIITLFGSYAMKEAAIKMNLQLTTSPYKPALDVRKICKRLICAKSDNQNVPKCNDCGYKVIEDDCACLKGDEVPVIAAIPESAFNLLHQMMNLDPNCRISAETALHHSFLHPIKCEDIL